MAHSLLHPVLLFHAIAIYIVTKMGSSLALNLTSVAHQQNNHMQLCSPYTYAPKYTCLRMGMDKAIHPHANEPISSKMVESTVCVQTREQRTTFISIKYTIETSQNYNSPDV